MTATPTTDQILANLADLNRAAEQWAPMSDATRDDIATFVERITDALPDVDPKLIGRVLLHAADLYGMYATWGNKQPLSDEAFAAVQMLGEAGRRLYLGDERATEATAE